LLLRKERPLIGLAQIARNTGRRATRRYEQLCLRGVRRRPRPGQDGGGCRANEDAKADQEPVPPQNPQVLVEVHRSPYRSVRVEAQLRTLSDIATALRQPPHSKPVEAAATALPGKGIPTRTRRQGERRLNQAGAL
jgi:hypothetical protein